MGDPNLALLSSEIVMLAARGARVAALKSRSLKPSESLPPTKIRGVAPGSDLIKLGAVKLTDVSLVHRSGPAGFRM
jgi:hypothetical protein